MIDDFRPGEIETHKGERLVTPGLPPREQRTEARRLELAELGKRDLYYLTKGVLGYSRLTPHAHGELCRFCDTCDSLRRMILMPRSHFKTTIVTISQTIQDIIKNPNIRILLVGSSSTNVERMLKEVGAHFLHNQLFRWLYPDVIHDSFNAKGVVWNNKEIQVPRTVLFREPTVDTIGARGTVESRHYDIIRPDDIIGEKELQSDIEMERTIEWASGLESLLISPEEGMIDFVGTHWRKHDVYEFIQNFYSNNEGKVEIGPHAYRRDEIVVFSRDARLPNGEPIFPELISKKTLDRIQRENPARYAAQYANNPITSGETEFKTENIQFFQFTGPDMRLIRFKDFHGNDVTYKVSDLDVVILHDPAVSERRGASDNALGLVGHHQKTGRIFVLKTKIGQYKPDELVEALFEWDKQHQPRFCSLEAVAYQKALKYFIRMIADARRIPTPPIKEYIPGSRKSKDDRIRGLVPLVNSHLIYMLPSETGLLEEFQHYTKDGKSKRDGLDMLAQVTEYFTVGWDEQTMEDDREAWRKQLSQLDATGYGQRRGSLRDRYDRVRIVR